MGVISRILPEYEGDSDPLSYGAETPSEVFRLEGFSVSSFESPVRFQSRGVAADITLEISELLNLETLKLRNLEFLHSLSRENSNAQL